MSISIFPVRDKFLRVDTKLKVTVVNGMPVSNRTRVFNEGDTGYLYPGDLIEIIDRVDGTQLMCTGAYVEKTSGDHVPAEAGFFLSPADLVHISFRDPEGSNEGLSWRNRQHIEHHNELLVDDATGFFEG